MSTPLSANLLEGGTSASPRSNRRVVAAVAALLLSAGLIGYSMGKNTNAPELDHDIIRAKLVAGLNQTDMAVVATSEACYGYTGGTCLTSPCKKERNSKCVDGKCACPGGCTRSDGTCGSSAYTKVGSKFTLSNKFWPSQWLFMQTVSLLSQLKVSSAMAFSFMGSQYFDLYELPGNIHGKKQYFLASNKWPTWVAAIRTTGSVLTASASLWGLYAVEIVHTVAPYDPQGIIVQFCSMKKLGYKDEIMVGSAGLSGRTEWAYVHHGTWFVYGWDLSQDPGEGGYWTVMDDQGKPANFLSQLDDC